MVSTGLVPCDGCSGCRYVADDVYRTPWIEYTMPLQHAEGGYIIPPAKRVYCNKCRGTGRMPAWQRSLYRRKKRKD